MVAHILSTNCAVPQPDPGGADRVSGIEKKPVEFLEISAPGPHYGDGSGVKGDVIGDTKHHGGADKAVYAFESEELAYWEERLGRPCPPGSFGENLTLSGIDASTLVINQELECGSTRLQVSVPRTPCRTFAGWMGVPGWLALFTEHGMAGSYFRVLRPGVIRPGDQLILGDAPSHGITMGMAFRAKMGDRECARAVVEANCLPTLHHEQLQRRL